MTMVAASEIPIQFAREGETAMQMARNITGNGVNVNRLADASDISSAGIGDFVPNIVRSRTIGKHRDLLVWLLHRVPIQDNLAEPMLGEGEPRRAALDLVNDRSVTRQMSGAISYAHLLFDRHKAVVFGGIETNSPLSGPQTTISSKVGMAADICTTFPKLELQKGAGYPRAARRIPRHYDAQLQRDILAA